MALGAGLSFIAPMDGWFLTRLLQLRLTLGGPGAKFPEFFEGR